MPAPSAKTSKIPGEESAKKPPTHQTLARVGETPVQVEPADVQRTTAAPQAAQPSAIVALQQSVGNRATTQLLQRQVIQRAGFVYGGSEEIREELKTQLELRHAIEETLDETFIGTRALFMAGGVATTAENWGELLYGMLGEDYDIDEKFGEEDCADIVETIKGENRKEEFLRITEFYDYFNRPPQERPWTLEEYIELLKRNQVYADKDKDLPTLQLIFEAEGKREDLAEDPRQAFQLGDEEYRLTEKELKTQLDELLGETVNWGHEVTDGMGDTGKKGELYYAQKGKELQAVGSSSQSHASSKGGRTIIWEKSGSTTEILAIGKHTTPTDSRLSAGASYQIVEIFSDNYASYKNKTLGFKN